MKRYPIFLFVFFSTYIFAQNFVLTEKNFRLDNNFDEESLIIEFKHLSKEQLFNKTKQFVNVYYNNPKYVTSESEKDQLVINAVGIEYLMFLSTCKNAYQYEINFKDGKLRITPKFKWIENDSGFGDFKLISQGMTPGVYKKNGKINMRKAKIVAEEGINQFIGSLKAELIKDSDW